MVGSEAGLSVDTNPIPVQDQQEMSGVTGWKQQPAGGPARRGALLPIYGSNSPKREFTAFKCEILPLKMRLNGRQKCNLKSVKCYYSPTS